MDKIITPIILLIIMGIGFYFLYINGYLVTNAKRAVMYIGSLGGRKANFTSCTGYTKRVIKFKESGSVHFNLDLEISKGDVTMELLDTTKQCILRLSNSQPSAIIHIDTKKRYFLVFRFKSASGRYLLTWECFNNMKGGA